MSIRKATLDDLPQLFSLYKSVSLDKSRLLNLDYQMHLQEKGFLLGINTQEQYVAFIKSSFFLVAEEEGIIIGYIMADTKRHYADDEYKIWMDTSAKEIYYTHPSVASITTIAVAEDHTKKGVATNLLQELETLLRNQSIQYLYSIIGMLPFTNCPSILFHAKKGFVRIAIGRPRNLFDLENYSSMLVWKPL